MLKIEDVMKRLNFAEQHALRQHINAEKLKNLDAVHKAVEEQTEQFKALNNTTWECVAKLVEIALLDHGLTKKKIASINDRIAELSIENSDTLLLDTDQIQGHELLQREEYEDLIEELVDCKCKGCSSLAKDCSLRPKLEKRKVPAPGGYKGKCKYYYV